MNADPRILHSLSSDLTFLESVVRLELAQPVLANKLQGLNKQVGIFPRSNLSGFGGIVKRRDDFILQVKDGRA